MKKFLKILRILWLILLTFDIVYFGIGTLLRIAYSSYSKSHTDLITFLIIDTGFISLTVLFYKNKEKNKKYNFLFYKKDIKTALWMEWCNNNWDTCMWRSHTYVGRNATQNERFKLCVFLKGKK